jgi:hypothetical protein
MANPLTLERRADAVTPTAHDTRHVWVRNGLSHPELATWEGHVLFDALLPAMTVGLSAAPRLDD